MWERVRRKWSPEDKWAPVCLLPLPALTVKHKAGALFHRPGHTLCPALRVAEEEVAGTGGAVGSQQQGKPAGGRQHVTCWSSPCSCAWTFTAWKLLLHFCLPTALQVSVMDKPNLEPHREGTSEKSSSGLVKLTQYQTSTLMFQSLASEKDGPVSPYIKVKRVACWKAHWSRAFWLISSYSGLPIILTLSEMPSLIGTHRQSYGLEIKECDMLLALLSLAQSSWHLPGTWKCNQETWVFVRDTGVVFCR